MAAATNFHRFRSLKHRCIISQLWRLEIQHKSHRTQIQVSAGLCSFPEARGEPAPWPSWRPEASPTPGLWFPSSVFHLSSGGWIPPLSPIPPLRPSLLPLASHLEDPCDDISCIQGISLFQGQLISKLPSICNLRSLVPHIVTYPQVQGFGCGHVWEPLSTYHRTTVSLPSRRLRGLITD